MNPLSSILDFSYLSLMLAVIKFRIFGHLLITYMIYPWAITDLWNAITLHIMFSLYK